MKRIFGLPGSGVIDVRNPVNWAHPLNRDLRAWFLALPVSAGGGSRTWRDLTAKTGDGTFSDGVAGHWKPPGGRPGGFGAVDLNGSNRVDTTSNAQQDLTGLSAIAMSAWIFPTATGDRVIMGRPISSGFDDQYYMMLNASTSTIVAGADPVFDGSFSLSIPWATNKWNHVLVTADASTAYCYVNGRLSASFASAGGTINSKSGAQFTIGSNRPIFFYQGQIDDVRLWARLLSATDAMQVYLSSLHGCEGVLNRSGPPTLTVTAQSVFPVGGSSSGVASTSCVATSTNPVAGSSSGVASTSCVATSTNPVTGSASGAASTSCVAASTNPVAGSASGAASTSCVATSTNPVGGSASGAASTSCTASSGGLLAGSASGVASTSCVAVSTNLFNGVASGTASTSCDTVASAVLAGVASGVATTSCSASGPPLILQGSASGAAATSCVATSTNPVAGSASGVASTSCVAAGFFPLAGIAVGSAMTFGTFVTILPSANGMLLFGGGLPVAVPRLVPTATATYTSPGAPPLPVAFPSFAHAMRMHQTSTPWMWMNTLWLFRVFPSTGLGSILQVIERIVPYGNILDDVVDPLVLFNTYRVNLTLLSLTGAGAIVDVFTTAPNYSPPIPPPNPPAPHPLPGAPNIGLLKPGQQVLFDVVILTDNDFSTADVRYLATYQIAGGGTFPFAFRIMGSRAVLFQYLPDWNENPPKIEEGYDTDVFASDQQHEQRTTTYDTLDVQHSFDVDFKVDGVRDGARLYNRLIRIRHRRAAVPFYSEPMEASADAAGSSTITVTSVGLDALMWKSEEIVRLDTDNPEYFEVRKVVSSDGITGEVVVDSPWISTVPKHQQLFFFVRYVSVGSVKRRNLNDQAHVVSVVFRSWD